MLSRGTRIVRMIQRIFPGLDIYYAGPGQPLTSAGEELHSLL